MNKLTKYSKKRYFLCSHCLSLYTIYCKSQEAKHNFIKTAQNCPLPYSEHSEYQVQWAQVKKNFKRI